MFFNAVFGNLYDQHAALLHCTLNLVKPGGFVVISHPEGRAWHTTLHTQARCFVTDISAHPYVYLYVP